MLWVILAGAPQTAPLCHLPFHELRSLLEQDPSERRSRPDLCIFRSGTLIPPWKQSGRKPSSGQKGCVGAALPGAGRQHGDLRGPLLATGTRGFMKHGLRGSRAKALLSLSHIPDSWT